MTAYFCTGGRGTEKFLKKEIKDVFEISGNSENQIVKETDGKVFFTYCGDVRQLLSLKTAERLFVQICCRDLPSCPKEWWNIHEYIAEAFESLDHVHWKKCLQVYFSANDVVTDNGELEPSTTFRISLKCSGSYCKTIKDQKSKSAAIAETVRQVTGWTTSLKSPEIEIYIHITNGRIVAGVPLSKWPLSDRCYIHYIGLRTTVAWIMAKLANIKAGDVVWDPMCGSGTILVEAAVTWQNALYYGSDQDRSRVLRAAQNVQCARLKYVHLVCADATVDWLKPLSIDAVVCDMPFGMQHSTLEDIPILYPQVLQQIDRVLVHGGRIVLLTSQQFKPLLVESIPNTSCKQCLFKCDLSRRLSQTYDTDLTNGQNKQQCIAHVPDVYTNGNKELSPIVNESCTKENKLDGMCDCINKPNWELIDSHNIKLGQTFACICVFRKLQANGIT